jgi:hypothetical protein
LISASKNSKTSVHQRLLPSPIPSLCTYSSSALRNQLLAEEEQWNGRPNANKCQNSKLSGIFFRLYEKRKKHRKLDFIVNRKAV